jgi:hypothetical protein
MNINIMMSNIGNTLSAVSRAYSFANQTVSYVELAQNIVSGALFDSIINQTRKIILNGLVNYAAPISARLGKADFWQEAALSFSMATPNIMSYIMKQLLSMVKTFNEGRSHWLIYMPTPWESWIPNLTFRTILPGIKVGKYPIELYFGGKQGDYRGRLIGFGTITKRKGGSEVTSQIFRMDYHPFNHQQSDLCFPQNGDNYEFHFHLGSNK